MRSLAILPKPVRAAHGASLDCEAKGAHNVSVCVTNNIGTKHTEIFVIPVNEFAEGGSRCAKARLPRSTSAQRARHP